MTGIIFDDHDLTPSDNSKPRCLVLDELRSSLYSYNIAMSQRNLLDAGNGHSATLSAFVELFPFYSQFWTGGINLFEGFLFDCCNALSEISDTPFSSEMLGRLANRDLLDVLTHHCEGVSLDDWIAGYSSYPSIQMLISSPLNAHIFKERTDILIKIRDRCDFNPTLEQVIKALDQFGGDKPI